MFTSHEEVENAKADILIGPEHCPTHHSTHLVTLSTISIELILKDEATIEEPALS
jgi:hypothetical protein